MVRPRKRVQSRTARQPSRDHRVPSLCGEAEQTGDGLEGAGSLRTRILLFDVRWIQS